MRASTMRSTISSLGLLAAMTLAAAAQDDSRVTLETAIREQGDASNVQDLYLRVRFKSFKEGSEGTKTEAEGFLREFYRPPQLFRVEVEADDGSGDIETAKVYDGVTGKGLYARINAATVHKGDHALDAESLERLRDQVRPLRFLLLDQFLREGAQLATPKRVKPGTRKVEWREDEKSKESLALQFEEFRLTKVSVTRSDGGQDYIVELSGHRRFGEKQLLFPTVATVFRKNGEGKLEKVLELQVVEGGLIVNPGIEGGIYQSAAEETPHEVD